MISQHQYQAVCDELEEAKYEIEESNEYIKELQQDNEEYREEKGEWVARLISEGERIRELEEIIRCLGFGGFDSKEKEGDV